MKEKWTTLEHNGVVFPKEYEYVGFDKNLSSLAEEMLYHYSAKLETEHVQNETFNKNFWNALKQQLPTEYQSKKFPVEFMPLMKKIYKYIQDKKEAQKNISKVEKERIKKEKDNLKNTYGYAMLNGEKQPLGMYVIEPPSIFCGRGNHPSHGCFKFRVKPSDVTINHSKHLNPPVGEWKVVENKKSMELATYDVRLSNGKTLHKRILFGATSVVKQNSDQKKFEKAIVLLKNWKKVESHIDKNLSSKDEKRKQSAIVSYLIMNLGIRVGDEKDDDLADTVGASSLRKSHIQLQKDNKIFLSFLGKDSVRFESTIEVSEKAYKTLQDLYTKRNNEDMLFPKVSSIDVNKFLSEVVDGISAKVFRTAYGSSLLAENLRLADYTNLTVAEKVMMFNKISLQVSKKLNHQKNIGKNQKEKEEKFTQKIAEKEKALSTLRIDLSKKIELLNRQLRNIDDTLTKSTQKQMKEAITDKIKKLKDRLVKETNKVQELKLKAEFSSGSKDISIITARTSYSDPRIGFSFCKDNEIPLDKIYSKSLLNKFNWVDYDNSTFYKKYPKTE